MKNKHLTLQDRMDIQEKLTQGESFRRIAVALEKSPTTISNELKKYRQAVSAKPYGRIPNGCLHRKECRRQWVCSPCRYKNPKQYCRLCKYCNKACADYERENCEKLEKAPYVCNPCKERSTCSLVHQLYDAKKAHLAYATSWKEDREGFYLTGEEIAHICSLVTPRLKRGHSPHAIITSVKDQLPCSASTIYRLLDEGELESRNGDLPRKMKFKAARRKRAHRVDTACREGRTYQDFLRFVQENTPPLIVEMDTVEGKKGGPVLLTLSWRGISLLRAHWRERNDAHSVKQWMDHYEKMLGLEQFKELFPVLLTDRGNEFTDPLGIEFSPYTGQRRTYVFYCDPQRSDQKGAIERNHVELRKIIPKGTDLNKWPQHLIEQVCDHLNSYPRPSLKGKSPHDAFAFLMGTSIPDQMGWTVILPEDIYLKEDYFRSLVNK